MMKYTARNTRKMAGLSPVPNRYTATGSQANGEIGASSVTVGSVRFPNQRKYRIRVPDTTPSTKPRPRPATTRSTVAEIVLATA